MRKEVEKEEMKIVRIQHEADGTMTMWAEDETGCVWMYKGCTPQNYTFGNDPNAFGAQDPDVFGQENSTNAFTATEEKDKTEEEEEEVVNAVLSLIAIEPMLSHEVREQLMKQGFNEKAVRNAVANLWDTGRLNVGLDQRLRPTEPRKI